MPPASPSWISLRGNRSTSMPQIRRSSGGGGPLKLWAQSILSGVGVTTPSPTKKKKPTTSLSERRRTLVAERQRHFQVPPTRGNLSFSANNNANAAKHQQIESPPDRRDNLPANVRVGIVLAHLQEHLPKYCELLQEPTFVNCQEACQDLAKAIARSMPTSTGSPKANTNTTTAGAAGGSSSSPHSTSSPISTPSPSRSPLLSLFGAASARLESSPPTRNFIMDSAMALEREWERYTMPLQLLAAAEALYANLHHAQDAYLANQLEGLYRWISDDLTLVKETLCDSVVTRNNSTAAGGSAPGNPSSASSSPPNYNDHRRKFLQETAQTIGPILLLLASMAKQRYRLIQYQATIWDNNNANNNANNANGNKKQFGLLGEAFDKLGKSWTNEAAKSSGPVANSLVESLSNELAIWKHLLETANYLEKCRFMESILSSRKTKVRLNPKSQLKMQQWFVSTLQQMIASSYLYFDRVHTFAKPLYGFQNAAFLDTENTNKSRMGGSPHALDDKVLDFLHKQQKSGTADVAVTIVHDAVQTSNLHMERGFTLGEESATTTSTTTTGAEDESSFKYNNELETARLHWPAVYIRSTKYHGEAQVGVSSLLGGKRRSASRKHFEDGNTSSFSEHYKRWGSKDSSASTPTATKKALKEANEAAIQRNTLEYAPDQGSASWPHTEWESIVGLVTGSGDLPSTARLVLSNREASTVTEEHGYGFFKSLLGQSSSTPTPMTQKAGKEQQQVQMECVVRRANNGRSAFWLAELSEFSWLVVLTKAEEQESRWHRRRGSRFDDVEEFVQLLVSNLRVENCFQTLPTEDLQEFPFERYLLQGIESVNDWNEKSAEDFLSSVKYAFGLSARKPKQGDPTGMYNRRFRIGNNSPSTMMPQQQPPKAPQVTMDSSAMAFFLGSDLMYGFA